VCLSPYVSAFVSPSVSTQPSISTSVQITVTWKGPGDGANTGTEFQNFQCGGWMAKDEGDGLVIRRLRPADDEDEKVSVSVWCFV